MYTIDLDEQTNTLVLTLVGFWDEPMQAAFARDYAPVIDRHRQSGVPFAILVDVRDFAVQSTAVLAGMTAIHERKASMRRGSPVAIVCGSVLLKRQAERAITGDNVRLFTDLAPAKAWLRQAM